MSSPSGSPAAIRACPWPARVLAMGVVAYALSPIDLIPDAIPVIGYLDDLILVPAGLWLVRRMIPPDVLADCRLRADAVVDRPVSRTAAVVIVAFWLTLATALTLTGWRWWRHGRG